MSLKLAARLVGLTPYKIADLQENDTIGHLLDLKTIVPPETIGIIIVAVRASGSGNFRVFGIGSSMYPLLADDQVSPGGTLVPIRDQVLKWSNSVANDDWDLILYGYFVQKRTR